MKKLLCWLIGHKLKFYAENNVIGDGLPFLNVCERCGFVYPGWDDLRK